VLSVRVPLAARRRRPAIGPGDVPQPLTGPGPYTLLECDAGELWFDCADEVIRPYVQRARTWEPEEGRLLLSLARPGMRFLDVGANIGYFTVLMAKHAPGSVFDAVEPEPGNARMLAMNLWHNKVEATVWPLALSAGERSLPLHLTEHNAGDTRTHAARPDQWYQTVAVAARGDELFGSRGFDLVKLDVQGFELDVLQGMPETIQRSPGIAVVAEFWPKALRDRKVEPYTVLRCYREMGFTILTQVDDQLRRMEDPEIIGICDQAGEWGQVNLLLRR
jgi:FkbM family methyltransferase